MSLWTKLFGKNDWYPVWADRAIWKVTSDLYGKYDDWATYEIQYSHSRNIHRLILGGRKPKTHPAYTEVVKKFQSYKEKDADHKAHFPANYDSPVTNKK